MEDAKIASDRGATPAQALSCGAVLEALRQVGGEPDVASRAALPQLPAELVVHVLSYLPIAALQRVGTVSRDWADAHVAEPVWLTVLRRRWSFSGLCIFGERFASWREVFTALQALPALHATALYARDVDGQRLDDRVVSFLHGIASGLMPTADGAFTYHEMGATPIHYRHAASSGQAPSARDGLWLGGEWSWSADRVVWHPTSTCRISGGAFGQSAGRAAWELVSSNRQIVGYLHRQPLVPLFAAEVALSPVAGPFVPGSLCSDLQFGPGEDGNEALPYSAHDDRAFWRERLRAAHVLDCERLRAFTNGEACAPHEPHGAPHARLASHRFPAALYAASTERALSSRGAQLSPQRSRRCLASRSAPSPSTSSADRRCSSLPRRTGGRSRPSRRRSARSRRTTRGFWTASASASASSSGCSWARTEWSVAR